MGLGNDEGRFAYVNISKGQLFIKKGDERIYYKHLEGYLTGLNIVEDVFDGKKYEKLCLNIHDGNENFQLQMRFDSAYGRAFCNAIENANLKEKMKIAPSMKIKDGKDEYSLFINQNGKALKWKYTNDHPGERPAIKKAEFAGQMLYDKRDQLQFFKEMLQSKIVPLLSGAYSIVESGPSHHLNERPQNTPVQDPMSITEPIDDLPF